MILRISAVLALAVGALVQGFLDGQVFTHAVIGILMGTFSIVCSIISVRKNRSRVWIGWILAGLGLALAVACAATIPSAYQHQKKFNSRQRPSLSVTNSPVKIADLIWQGFGTPGPGKIAVNIVGEVEHPGRYHLERGTSLLSMPLSAGGLIRRGGLSTNEHLLPQMVVVRRTKDNKPHKMTYPIVRMSEEELDSVKLQDGDTVEYPQVIF